LLNETVVEIGCGVGLDAVVASICGAELVVATDLRENLEVYNT
jgi:predicted nicotinamide N-methyase